MKPVEHLPDDFPAVACHLCSQGRV
jgi:hypothetical protein